MVRKVFVSLLIAAILMALLPAQTAEADSAQVLLVYNDKEAMTLISGLIEACGMTPQPLDSIEYVNGMAESYDYVVLQDEGPLQDVLQLGKKVVCLGSSFAVMPGVQIKKTDRVMHAQMNVYGNTQSVIVQPGTAYIGGYSGEAVGSISMYGGDYPLGVMNDQILYAPYLSADDLSAFAVAKMLNRYFGRQDGGKMFVMIDEVYPFDDIEMLELTADKLYENGIPFIMSIMPVYYNTEYPSFTRYANALRYIQSKSGSFIMHDPLVTGNELVGESLDTRLQEAYAVFEENGVHVFDHAAFPYEVSLDMLSSIQPQNQLFISLPVNTVIKFDVFEDEAELDAAIDAINQKWLQIGDYRRYFTDNDYVYQEEAVDTDYAYREEKEQRYAFLVDAGNQVLLIVVLVSAVIIIGLILFGYRLYRNKFLKKGK